MKLRIIFLVILLLIIIVGLVLPNGILAAVRNNLWSIYFVKAAANNADFDLTTLNPPALHAHAGLLIAHQALKRGEFDLAEAVLDPLLNRQDDLVRNANANFMFIRGDYTGAIEIWYQLGEWHTLEQASKALEKAGEKDALILALEKAYALFPERYAKSLFGYKLIKANSLMLDQDYPDAINILNDLLGLSSRDGRPYALLAQAHYQTGQFEQALAALRDGWNLNEGNIEFYLTAGKLYEGMNLPGQALTAYQAALALNPQSIPALEGIERLSVDTDE